MRVYAGRVEASGATTGRGFTSTTEITEMQHNEPIFRLPPLAVETTYRSLSETIDWGLSMVGVPEQWQQTRGQGIRVAVLDTGIDENHVDLAEAIDDARDFTRSRSGPIDKQGHGTHVAGTIAARQNDVGVIGVAPECRLLVGKVLGDDGSGTAAGVAAGIDWACDSGAQIISMSLGSARSSEVIHAAIVRATEKGRFVICAAGNDGRPSSVNYPGRWSNTIAVAAVDRSGRVTRFSSRGAEVDVSAPGQDVLSTYLNGGYAKLSGTSMAAPMVAGVVTLMLSKHVNHGGRTPVTNTHQLREHLRRTSTDAGPRGHDPAYGWGLINPASMLRGGDGAAGSELSIGPLQVNGIEGALVFVPEE